MNAPVLIPSLPDVASAAPKVADPGRDIRFGTIIAILFFVAFGGWAAFARLDAAAFASGTLIVSGQRQAVQHRDGGVVQELRVREGERVVRGQLLLRLVAAEVRAQERVLSSQAIRLFAQRERLQAEQLGESHVSSPPEFASIASADQPQAAIALRLQQAELAARLATLSAKRGALAQHAAQSGQQGRGFGDQVASSAEQLRIIDQELAALSPLAEKGFVSKTRVRDLERARAQIEGQRGQFSASVAETQEAARGSRIQILEAEREFRERAASDLRDVENLLGEILPKLAAVRDQLARADIRAPATGAVVGLSIFTPGGVIAPGQKLMDIVPERSPLRIQARISLDDADDLQVGQRTLVKFPSLHDRRLPDIEGTLSRLSADSLTDEKSGQSYFTGEVEISPKQLQLLDAARDKGLKLRAGMPVQILIPLRKRTALDYAFEPLLGAFWASFREH